MKDLTVDEGECLSQIAFEHGFFWQTLWNHDGNADLKSRRSSPFVLSPGDQVHVPDLRAKTVSLPTGRTHTFKRRGVPARLQVVLRGSDGPLANRPFKLELDGRTLSGTTDGNGKVSASLPPNTQRARLVVGTGDDQRVYELMLRRLDPETQTSGIQGRLRNLGYFGGEVDGEASDELAESIRSFEAANGLSVTGEENDELRRKLLDVHGC